MRRPSLAWVVSIAIFGMVLAGLGTHLVAAAGPEEPRPPVPRVCWFSDYDNARLSNQCIYDEAERTWLIRLDDRLVPADGVPLPEANLCHYFSGLTCPERRRPR